MRNLQSEPVTTEDKEEYLKKCTVAIRESQKGIIGTIGTGVIVTDDGLILTCYHVIGNVRNGTPYYKTVDIHFHEANITKSAEIVEDIKDCWVKDTTITLPTSDFELAVGTFKLESMGHLRMHRIGEEVFITGVVRHLFKDEYDFNPGYVFPFPGYTKNSIRVLVYADELNLLVHCRNAKNFKQDTCWEQNLEATVKFPINEFR